MREIAIIGAGKLGRSIACASLCAGYATVLEDVSRQSLEQGIVWIKQELNKKVSSEKTQAALLKNTEIAPDINALSLLSAATNVEDAIRDADLIIEAVPDELEMKLELFTVFDKFAKPGAIFATTSVLHRISDISDVVVFREHCVSLHFHEQGSNNEWIEIVKTPLTSHETLEKCREVAQRMAKQVAIIDEESSVVPETTFKSHSTPNHRAP